MKKELTRRSFLKLAGVGALAVADVRLSDGL